MAEAARKVTVSHSAPDEDQLPLPPPPPVPPLPLDYEASGSLPLLPPKETFATFYQQRQKSELKRLFKHMHPDLHASLHRTADEDIMKAVHSQTSHAEDTYQGEVQSMRWIFENWTLDNIGDPHVTKKLLNEEDLSSGDVRGTSSMFQNTNSSPQMSACAQRQTSVRGDVRTSTWLFETQPLDSLNASRGEDGEVVEAVLKEPIHPGDVRGTRLLFESRSLCDLGRCNSIEDRNFLKLRSEVQEQKGDVQKTVKLFQAEPRCAIRDTSGSIHEVKSICSEEINGSSIRTARWLFQTQPLDLINKGTDRVNIIRGISLEEGHRAGVDRKRWMFETQPFDTIQEVTRSNTFEGTEATEANVGNKRKLFETHHLSTLKGDSAEKTLEKEEIIGGDVRTSLWLFETQPMEALNHNYEVGQLKKISLSGEERGEVRGKKQMFESCGIQKTTSSKELQVEKVDVKGFKRLFETIPLCKLAHSHEEKNEVCEKENAIAAGNVKDNKVLFESTPLYAIRDSSGNLHEVTTVSREESIQGKVQNYKWMFDTKPLDQLMEGKGNVEVIKGITRQEDATGDVKTAKWLFETQTINGIHSRFNQTQPSSSSEELHKGNVKACKWLFETQPMDILSEKTQRMSDKDAIDTIDTIDTIDAIDVKSFTWLFESQPLDSINDDEEYNLKLCSTVTDSLKSEVSVQTVKHLFETETLDRIQKDATSKGDIRCVSQVDLQSGDVSRVKELFESQSLDEIGSETVSSDVQSQDEGIEKGSVNKFTWIFENCPMNMINKDEREENTERESVESGDVQNKKFIFETSSLDKIHNEDLEQKSVCVEKPASSVDVKSSSMMFESLPLYAIRDKEGQFHEVTTVKKEEVMSADMRGARWMFETKPLDAIKAENQVYVIRAVTQEDVKKGDVKSARWKFETQPLDSFSDQGQPSGKVIQDVENCNVQLSKQIFESDQSSEKFVRTVSVTDMQRGNVRTSTWLFENQSIDSLKGEPQEQSPVKTVHREDSQKGDVKRCTWLFESQPLDKIKESETTTAQGVREEIPKSDVKCTTWLFETTPLDQISSNSVADTLSYLYQKSFIHSSGITIEASKSNNVHMAKYLLENNEGVKIQKEEAVGGNIRNIMLQLLLKPTLKPQVTLLREVEEGQVNTTVVELPVDQTTTTVCLERDQRIQNTVRMMEELLVQSKDLKKGIVMQESEDGQAEMSIYSLICRKENKAESHQIERGDVKSTIGNLLATANTQKTAASCRVDETEKGNVNLYKRCIEQGELDYLKSLQCEAAEDEVDHSFVAKDHIEIVQGDVREAKRSLCQQKDQVERTISDVLPGDVKNTKKVFSSECSFSVESCTSKEDIVRGDVSSAKQQLTLKQPVMVEKEEIVAGDIKATMESLERAKQQSLKVEREIIKPGTIYDMELSQAPETEGCQAQKEVIISGDVKAAKKSLEIAKQQSMYVEREVIVPGNIYNLDISAQEETSSTVTQSSSSSRCQQIKTYSKVSDAVKDQDNHVSLGACQQSAVVVSKGAPQSLPPLISCECNGLTDEDETGEVIRGDVKAAIKSLQSAATEQKLLDKEDIVRGNVQLALLSLERSSVNVSKGDFKAAMIYKNSARACPGRSTTVHKQGVVMSVLPSDTNLSPFISVTGDERPSVTTQNSTPGQNGNCKSSHPDRVTLPPLPQNTSENPRGERPALPPKPQLIESVVVEEQNVPVSSSEMLPPNAKQSNPLHMSFTGASQQTMQSKCSKAHQRHAQCGEPAADWNQTSQCLETMDCSTNNTGNIWKRVTVSKSAEVGKDRNVIQKINTAEEIQRCTKSYAQESRHETNTGLQAALHNFDTKGQETPNKRGPSLSKKVKVVDKPISQSPPSPVSEQKKTQTSETNNPGHTWQNSLTDKQQNTEAKVVLRDKKGKETEAERRQRLSVHKEEIMKGNVQATMEIFQNLRKREELKGILSQVEEIVGESAGSSKMSHKNHLPTQSRNTEQSKPEEKKVDVESQDEDLESISSVESAFEDLEKASKEILQLKQETLTKLLDIEEAIKKALFSVSNLKSEADIAGLSGLFDESFKSEHSFKTGNNIRKISIGSNKTKAGQKGDVKVSADAKPFQNKALIRPPSSTSSPSFISIHSAARKPLEKPPTSTFKLKTDVDVSSKTPYSPTQRDVSVLQVETLPEQPTGILGTKMVSETYEETDGFGNVFVSSVTSTVVTKQSERYKVMFSPLTRRSGHPFEDQVFNKPKEEGTVFVTFNQPVEKH